MAPTPFALLDPIAGVSGDMLLGALIDAGVPPAVLASGPAMLPISGYRLEALATWQYGLRGTACRAHLAGPPQPHRRLVDIVAILRDSALPTAIQDQAVAVFQTPVVAEAQVHGTTVSTVQFHEVWAVDALVDVVGTVLCLAWLGVTACYLGPDVDRVLYPGAQWRAATPRHPPPGKSPLA